MKNLFSKKRVLQTFGAALLAMSLMGCGQAIVGDDPATELMDPSLLSGGPGTPCSAYPNITPADLRELNGNSYTACAGPSSTRMTLSGQSPSERIVCVYPVEFKSSTQYVYKLGLNGVPRSGCYDSRSYPSMDLEFTNVSYNGVIIVEGSMRSLMNNALITGYGFPLHSVGRFR